MDRRAASLGLAFALGVGVLLPALAHGTLAAEPEPLARFLVLGDTGTGAAGQYHVKDGFMTVCAARGCDFAMINGDLIYDTGVSSVDDPQFQTKFEMPYADVPLTFYLTTGNHDNSDPRDGGLGTDPGRGDIEVAYHSKPGTSGKWYLPARSYEARIGDVSLFSLDTNTMMSYGVTRRGADPVATVQDEDPAMLAQERWLDAAMAASDARWKIAFGHHPLYANGEHGNAGAYDGQGQDVAGAPFPTTLGLGVKLFLESHVCGKADLYLAGHDHDLEWLQPNASCGATELIVSGAGSKSRPLQDPARNPVRFQQGGTTGFWWISLADDAMTAACYDADATLLYELTIPKPLL
ncbi:MAG TPA: metallophosphoesterase [Candidatus Thermoplasmatota archaeon]|nr:metallophosphoesterase [Candidatus Thermoplasmatota archaeon]